MDRLLIKVIIKSFVLISFIFIGCNRVKTVNNNHKLPLSVAGLIETAFKYRNDTVFFQKVCEIINDSINSQGSRLAIRSITIINYEKENILWKFENCEDDIPHFTDNLTFDILIKDTDSIFVRGSLIKKINEIQEQIKEFTNRPDSTCKCYIKKNIDFFGEVELPKGGVLLSLFIKQNDAVPINVWKTFFKSMDELISFYENRRNEISVQKWNIKYNSLSIDKKIAATEMTNMVIFIIFKKDNVQ